MARNWWDSSRLADEEEKWWESSAVADEPPRDAGGGRGDSINPPMAGQPQPKFPRLSPSPAPAPIDYGQAATDMMGTPMSAPPAPAAPAAPAKPAPYKNRLEALDDAVNLVEEGADFKRVAQSFTQIGIGEGDIIAHGIGRKSPMFQDPGLSRRQIDDYVKPELKPMPQPTAEAKPFEPTALQEIGNTLRRGQLSAAQGVDNLAFSAGMFDTGTMAERMRERQRQVGAAAPSGDVAAGLERLQEANETGDYGRVAGELIRPENWKALAALVAESAVASSPAILTTVAGTVLAGPIGGATAAGLTSLSMEYGAALGEELQKRKVNMSDAVAVRRVLEDDQFLQDARERGLKRGIPVAAFDALSAGFAGRFLRTVQKAADAGIIAGRAVPGAFAGAALKEAGLQVGSGVAGEGLAQIATGENKPLDVFIEGLAELPGGLAEVAGNLRSARGMTPEARIADAIQSNVEATTFGGADAAARAAMSPYSNADTNLRGGIVGSTINFTPPDSITAQAGLAPIVVPTAPAAAGGTDVGLPDVLGGLAGGSGVAGGSDPLAGLGGAGRDAAVPGAGGVNAAGALAGDGGAALLGAGATQPGPSLSAGRGDRATDADLLARAEQAAGLTEASKPLTWAGRTKTGYANEQDAEQAMATASTVIDTRQTHDWRVEPMGNGRFQIVGYQKGDASGTAVTGAAGQGLATTASGSGAQQPGVAGAGMVDLGQGGGNPPGLPGGAATVGGAAANEPAFTLKLAPPAPLRSAGQAITMLKNARGVDVELHAGDLTDQQKVASAMARLVGKTVTYLDYVAGPADEMPNGFVIPGKDQNIYLDSKSSDGALFVMMHEGVHALPQPIREKLVTTIKGLTKTDMRADFAQKFQYDINNESEIDNEIAAFMTQAVTKQQDFWQELRTKMGDGDFTEVAKVILDKLNTFIQGAQSAYGDDFIKRYATDAVAVRDAVSTAYADAMKAQGQQAPAASTTAAAPGITASNRPQLGESFLKATGFSEFGPAEGEWVRPVSKLGDVIAKVVSAPGEPVRMEISADYMGRRFGTKVAEGEPAIKAAIEWASSGIQQGREKLAAKFMADERGLPGGSQTPRLTASNRAEQKNAAASRIDDVSADRFKRTPALQVALQDLQEGRITRAEYSKVVDEARPVYPYKELPEIATEDTARFALANGRGQSVEKAAKFGLPAKELAQGEMAQLRLDIPSYQEHDAWVVSVHRPKTTNRGVQAAYDAGPVVGYESVASITNATFGMRQSSALKIAQGTSKGTIATVLGEWKPITPAEAKVKAQAAMKSKDWTQVGMDPFRHSYFYDRDSMRPVVAADEVIQVGPLVLAKNAQFDDESDVTGAPLMFSNKVRPAPKASDYDPKVDNYVSPKTAEFLPAELVERAKGYVSQFRAEAAPVQISGADRIKAEGLLRPRLQLAQEAKLDYDQKILDIAQRTGAIGQKLAPVKGMKRAAEKLTIDEKFNVDNMKDLLRSTIVVDSYDDAPAVVDEIRKDFEILRVKNRTGVEMQGGDVDNKGFLPSGYGDVLINVRTPNGTLAEIQINVPEMLAAKDEEGHSLYEIERDQPEGSAAREAVIQAQTEYYREAAAAAERRKNASSEGAAERGMAGRSTSSPVASSSLNTLPSGNLTQSSPEKSATNSQPAGNLDGTFIGTPDKASVSQGLSQGAERAVGRYTYTTDSKGRIIVKGDTSRIRFLTRKLGLGIVTDEGVRFKADEAKAVLKALGEEPTVNPEIAKAIAEQLGLTPEELASTSLEYQTGQPKDRAFVAPLQGQIPETVQFLEQRRRSSGLPLLDISKPDDQATLARLIAAETLAAIRASGNALQWYDETIARTLAMAAVKYPELGKDPNAQMVFRVAMAITSQGLNVENNLKFTMRQYDAFRKQGSFPEIGEGDSSQAMIKNFELVNALLREMGPNMLRRFLVTPFSVGELNAAGFSPEGELVDEQVLGSSVFGPKIGFGFYSNLNGNFEPVTMDMWFMRTIGRLTGYLRAFDPAKFSNQIKRFRDAFGQTGTDAIYADRFDPALVAQASTDQEAAIALARLVKKAHEKDYKDNRAAFDAGTRKKSELVLAADTMITSVDKPKDVPGNGTERRQMREVVRQAVAMVEDAYGQRVPPAAMQALIWYPEQELYKALGVKLSVTSQDYAGATEKVLKDEGYDEKRLRAAAESGSRGARRKARQDVQAGNQPAGSAPGKAGPLEGAERDQFLRERYEASELAKERVEPKRKGIVFEVAPDPNNERLTAAWRTLTAEQRRDISDRVAREIVPRVLAQFDTDGIITSQVGSYLDDTNPSFTLLLNKGDVVKVAKALGFVLAQDSMMVVSPKEFDGGEKNSALVIEVGDKTPAQISAIYKKLRQIKVKGERPIGGQSYANGGMTILNYSSLPTSELAILVDQKLNKAYSILTRDVFAAFPEKKDYDYASETNDGRGSRAVLRQRARDLRAEASAALERELAGEGIQFSNRAGSDAASGGRDRGVGQEDLQGSVTPSYGTPREGAASAVGYHYSTQPRTSLISGMFGTGLRGAEMERLRDADPRLKQRVYFYIDRGTGINPEAGVGGYAHRVNLQNLYDVDEDALRLRRDATAFNAFESAVIDAGFDGYMVRDAGPSGNAVLLGQHAVPVEQLGSAGRLATADAVAPARDRVLNDAEKIAANKSLPSGQVSGKQWAAMIKAMMPEVYERLAGNPVWQSDKTMYRSELAKELRDSAPALTASNRMLPKVSPQSALEVDIARSSANLERAIASLRAGRSIPNKLVVGRLPHVLNMLGARTQEFDIASSIVKKVFVDKHQEDFGGVSVRDFVRAMYRPAMVLKSKDGVAREYELVLPITGEKGAVIVPIKVSVDKDDPLGAVMSAYQKEVSTANNPKEMTVMKRVNDGNLLYVDPGLAKQAITGRKPGDARDGVKLNENFVSWASVWPKLEKQIADRKVKTDTTLMGWIGDNYKPSSSPDGWQDAPSFSNRVRETPESVAIIVSGRTMRVPNPAGAVEKLDAKINRYSELLKCLQ